MKTPIDSTYGNTRSDTTVESTSRAIFTAACNHVPAARTAALARARRAALTERPARISLPRWAPLAGAAACCVLVAGIVWMHPALRTAAPANTAAIADTGDVLPDVPGNQIDMVQNLDFYRWLATQPAPASASAGTGH